MMVINTSKYSEIGRKLRGIPQDKMFVSHEWEELVEKLCASDDAGLHDIGIKELHAMKCKHTVTIDTQD